MFTLEQKMAKVSIKLGGTAHPLYPPELDATDAAIRLGGINPATLRRWTQAARTSSRESKLGSRRIFYKTIDIERLLDDPHRGQIAQRAADQLRELFNL